MSDEERELPPDRLWRPTTAKWFLVIMGVYFGQPRRNAPSRFFRSVGSLDCPETDPGRFRVDS